MRRSAAALAIALCCAAPAGAQVLVPLAAPPVATNAASSAIFDAMLAIARAAVANPAAAQAASFPYAAAIQRYAAGDRSAAQRAALEAIAAAAPATVPLASPALAAPVVALPVPRPVRPTSAAALDTEAFLALAAHALGACLAADRARWAERFADATSAAATGHFALAQSAARDVVSGCAGS